MSLKKNFIYNLLLVFSQLAFPIIILPYISRILGPTNIGKFNLVDNFAQYFIMFSALGISIYGIREISNAKNMSKIELDKKFSELFSIHSILTIFLFFVYLILVFNYPVITKNKYYYLLGSVQFLLGVFSLEWFFQGIENFKFIALRTFFIKLVSIILILFFVKKEQDSFLYYIISTITFIISSVANILFLLKNITFRLPKISDLIKHIKPLLTFFTTKFVISVYVTLTTILLGFIASEKDVGLFSTAYKVYNLTLSIVTTITTVVIARASVLAEQEKKQEFNYLINTVLSIVLSIGLPASLLIYLLSQEIIMILGGSQFLGAITSLKIMAVLVVIISLSNVFALNILTPLKRERMFLISTFVGMVVSLILNFLLIPKLGYIGASIGLLVSETTVCMFLLFFSIKFFKFTIKLKTIIRYLYICIPFIWLISLTRYLLTTPLITFFAGFSISVIWYAVSLVFIIKDDIWVYYFNQYRIKILQRWKRF